MALILNFDTASTGDCKNFNLFDTTGTGVGGWGNGGNPIPSDVTGASFDVTPYGSTTTYEIIVLNGVIPFPNDTNLPITILNTQLGLTADQPIPSGIYSGTYNIGTGIVTATVTKYFYLDCLAQCCANQAMARAIANNCECNKTDKDLQLAMRLQGMISAVHHALSPQCNKVSEAVKISNLINAICAGSDCGCK